MSPLNISLIQSSLHWEDISANLEMLEQKIGLLPGKPELVLLPEMFSTGFSMRPQALAQTMDGTAVTWMRRLAASHRIILAGSLIIKEDSGEGERYFNRMIWMLPTGDYGYYDKRHRFAYAGEDEAYTAGNRRLIASAKGWKINLQICYDLRFPVWSRQQPAPGNNSEYDLLVYVANWPEKRSHAWKTLLQARAIENQCYVAGVNRVGTDGNSIVYNGDSMLVDPSGHTMYTNAGTEDAVTLTLDPVLLSETRERFPFWKDADRFIIT